MKPWSYGGHPASSLLPKLNLKLLLLMMLHRFDQLYVLTAFDGSMIRIDKARGSKKLIGLILLNLISKLVLSIRMTFRCKFLGKNK